MKRRTMMARMTAMALTVGLLAGWGVIPAVAGDARTQGPSWEFVHPNGGLVLVDRRTPGAGASAANTLRPAIEARGTAPSREFVRPNGGLVLVDRRTPGAGASAANTLRPAIEARGTAPSWEFVRPNGGLILMDRREQRDVGDRLVAVRANLGRLGL